MRRFRFMLASCLWALLLGVILPPSLQANEAGISSSQAEPAHALALNDAVQLALQNHELLAQADAEITRAQAGLMEARSARLPQLNLAGEYAYNLKKPSFFLSGDFASAFGGSSKIEIGEDFEIAGGITATWNLWTAGRISAACNAAGEWLSVRTFQENATADLVRYLARTSYYDVLLAQENLLIEETALAETEEAARVATAGFQQGTVSRFDQLRAEVELANRRAPLLKTQNGIDQSMLQLKRICGLPTGMALELTDPLTPMPSAKPAEELVERMWESNPELKALKHVIAARRQEVRLQEAERSPSLQLSGQYALQSQWSNDFAPDSDNTATSAQLALGLNIPIFDGLRTKARIQGAQADLRIAEYELELALNEKELAVRQTHLSLASALAALEGSQEAVRLAKEAHRLALVRLENGLATPLERLDAELALTTAHAQLASSVHASNVAHAALELTIGDGNRNASIIQNPEEDQ